MVVDVLTKAVEKMKEELDERKSEKNQRAKPKRSSSNKKDSPKNANKKITNLTAEEKFKDMISDVRTRLKSIKFTKDGFKQYSDVQ
jgi:sugar-specific transcriptional regulator TrmB